ncbi:hypothetical protein PpBr36_04188 [Pyricularia pennisetigena]|uniref:hypothetical protein n=1 Tax=Pyricularia pennisetigena TaxID=1578925 RepID=UPI00115403AB|nr:hypothetical protein PpBr36_04188 [Pyricularia pennisetigena]TLS27422.1 hypothetical protein PpBr36_04188 [Pyricularia pennisetigena]
MAILPFLTVLTAALPLASAHFGLEYPSWRANTLAGDNENYSQWTYPCAGVPSNATGNNVTDWPLDGGSLVLDLHHPWTYLFVNLGVQINVGSTVSNFNYSLSGQTFWNVTGNGTLCIEKLQLPDGFKPKDGDRASIQVVTTDSGPALYNCADITFRANATRLSGDRCKSSNNVKAYQVQSGPASSSNGSGGSSTTTPGQPSSTGGVAANGVSTPVLTSVVGLAVFFAYSMAL